MTRRAKVSLSRWERKERLGHGAVKAIAAQLAVDPALVSRVVNGRQRHAGVENAVADRIGLPVDECFPPRAVRSVA